MKAVPFLVLAFALLLAQGTLAQTTIYANAKVGIDIDGCGLTSDDPCHSLTYSYSRMSATGASVLRMTGGVFGDINNVPFTIDRDGISLVGTDGVIIDCFNITASCINILLPVSFGPQPSQRVVTLDGFAVQNFHPNVTDFSSGEDWPTTHSAIQIVNNWRPAPPPEGEFEIVHQYRNYYSAPVQERGPIPMIDRKAQDSFIALQGVQSVVIKNVVFSNNEASPIMTPAGEWEAGSIISVDSVLPNVHVNVSLCTFDSNSMQSVRSLMANVLIDGVNQTSSTVPGSAFAHFFSSVVHPWWGGASNVVQNSVVSDIYSFKFVPIMRFSGVRCNGQFNEAGLNNCNSFSLSNLEIRNNTVETIVTLEEASILRIENSRFTSNTGYAANSAVIVNVVDRVQPSTLVIDGSTIEDNELVDSNNLIAGFLTHFSSINNTYVHCTNDDNSKSSAINFGGHLAVQQTTFDGCVCGVNVRESSVLTVEDSFFFNGTNAQITSLLSASVSTLTSIVVSNVQFNSTDLKEGTSYMGVQGPVNLLIAESKFTDGERILNCTTDDSFNTDSFIEFVGGKTTFDTNSNKVAKGASENCVFACNVDNINSCPNHDDNLIIVDNDDGETVIGMPIWLQVCFPLFTGLFAIAATGFLLFVLVRLRKRSPYETL